MLQAFILLPVGALLYLPFLRLAARWLALERLSFGAAFQLGVIVWASGLVASQVALPFIPEDRALAAAVLAAASLAVGRSVGVRKGFYLAAVSQALLAAVLAGVFGLALLLGHAF
jgi:hypothetical protein